MTPDRFYVNVAYNDVAGNHFGIFYNAYRGGANYSYMYATDLNNDNYNYDAIYIPSQEDVASGTVKFLSDDDATRFFDFAKKDAYLSKHMGQYAEAYSVYSPWQHHIDLHYAHDFRLKIGNTTNTLQLSLDVKNVANLFNDSWGLYKTMNPTLKSGRILDVERIGSDGIPVLKTPAAVSGSTQTWIVSPVIGQLWYAQVGLKYMFN